MPLPLGFSRISRDSLLLNAAHILMDGLFASVPILLSFVALFFGAGEKSAGVIVALGGLLSTLGGLSTKFFSARLGLWATLGLVLCCSGAGFFFCAFAPHLVVAGGFFVLSMAGMGLFHSLTFAHLTTCSERRALGRVLGDYTAIGDMGRIPIASLAGFGAAFTLAGQPGWRGICLLYGAATLIFALYLLRKGRAAREGAPGVGSVAITESASASAPPCSCAAAGAASSSSVSSGVNSAASAAPAAPGSAVDRASHLPSFTLLLRPAVAAAMLTNALDGFGSTGIFTFLPFLLFAKGVEPVAIGGFALAFTVGSFAGKTVCGRLVGTLGARRVFVVTELCMVALLAALVAVRDIPLTMALCVALGMTTTGTVPALQALLVEPVREKSQYEDIFALSSLFRGGINMLTPLLFGFMAASLSIESAYICMAVAGTLAVLPIVAGAGNRHA